MKQTAIFSLCFLIVGGCAEMRDTSDNTSVVQPNLTYLADIKPLFNSNCVSCHGATEPAGDYRLDTWRNIFGAGTDQITRNLIPGDARSLLLTKLTLNPSSAHDGALSDTQLETLRSWIVDDQAAYFRSQSHPPTWLYPGDRNAVNFHGGDLRAAKWNTDSCQTCHGQDLSGGASGESCFSCHAGGVSDCSTCHGMSGVTHPPADLSWNLDPRSDLGVGAHAAHANSVLFGTIGCNDCHLVPETADAPGHLFDNAETQTTDLRAEVIFGERAKLDGVAASYDRTTGNCTVYCHTVGQEIDDDGEGSDEPPATTGGVVPWTGPEQPCGSCHSVPFGNVSADCSICHQRSVERCTIGEDRCLATDEGVGIRFLEQGYHGDGDAPLGKEGAVGTCYGCHGTSGNAGAPAPDLTGKTSITEVTVGLHARHLAGSQLRDAVPCESCHRVPTELDSAGHIDDASPAEVTFSDLARGKTRSPFVDLNPTWDRNDATCTNTYCHSLNGSVVSEWRWNERLEGGLICTSCHGMPPARTVTGGGHPSDTDCSICHSPSYSNGLLDPAKHINGIVELDQ